MAKPLDASHTAGRFYGFRLARVQGTQSGVVDAATLPRVADRLLASPAPIRWRIDGTHDSMGRLALAIELDGEVVLECQRCLGPLVLPIAQRNLLLLAHGDDDAEQLDADSDAEVLVASTPLEPATLVEDELVLTLPYAARHADGECTAPSA